MGIFKVLWRVGAVLGGLITAGFNAKDAFEVGQIGFPTPIWTAIGLSIFFISVLALVYGQHKDNATLRNEIKEITEKNKGEVEGSSGIGGIEYFANRSELPKINEEFKNVKKGWVLWYTGYGAYGYGIHLKKHSYGDRTIERIILLNPKLNYESLFSDYLVNKADFSSENAEHTILDISRGVLKSKDYPRKVRIKWLDIMPPALYVINNPNGDDAWVRIEVFDLNKRPDEWQSYRIYKSKHLWVFNELKRAYEELWAKSDDIELVGEQICVRKA